MNNQLLARLPRSLTAPDALIALCIASYLQYKQYARRRHGEKTRVHRGATTKPQRNSSWSLVHGWLFNGLYMMISPLANQASEINADMVDLKDEDEIEKYAQKITKPTAVRKPNSKISKEGDGKAVEVRSRRIVRGELVYNTYYPAIETTTNLLFAVLVGIASRWVLGLIRSLRLSTLPAGLCCSPYRGSNDAGTREAGSFERLLACVLIKYEGDNASSLILSWLLIVLLVCVLSMAWSVSSASPSKNDDLDDAQDTKNDSAQQRIHPKKVKRFVVFVGTTLLSLWLFHTPALLRELGLDGLTEASEEWGARVLLYGNLLGIVSLPTSETSLEIPSEALQTLMNMFFILLALICGYIASVMLAPINETARNAAHILSPSPKTGNKKNPNEMLDLINARMMLLIMALAPFMIMCTYLANARFVQMSSSSSGDTNTRKSFSNQYLTNSGLFIRVAFAWCFVAASSYTVRALLQSYLDQAASVASAMAALDEDSGNNEGNRRGAKDRQKGNPSPPQRTDPFQERYKNIVLTAGRIIACPILVLAMLSIAHIRGGDGSIHPGVDYDSQPKNAPRSILPVKGLDPPYRNDYMSWIAKQRKGGLSAGDELLHAATLSHVSWDETPMRNSAHKKVADWLGRRNVCYPPESRSVKAMGRQVDFLLESTDDTDSSIMTMNPFTGRELLDMAPSVPLTLVDVILGKKEEKGSCDASSDESLLYPLVMALLSHNFMTPTVVFEVINTLGFLLSVYWTYFYSIKMAVYWTQIHRAASTPRIMA